MRFLIDEKSYLDLHKNKNHPTDCYVRNNEYLHHLYVDGVKYVVARALLDCLKKAEEARDQEAMLHLSLHKKQLDQLLAEQKSSGAPLRSRILGDPPPKEQTPSLLQSTGFIPPPPRTLEETGLNRTLYFELILRTIYNLGRPTGSEVCRHLGVSYQVLGDILAEMRAKDLIDIAGQSGVGEMNYEYILKPPRGSQAAEDALRKTEYLGRAPVPFSAYVKAVNAQTIYSLEVTRNNIRRAFEDLVITDDVLSEIGPAVNSAASIFLFGYAGNGKTSIAERITRLLGDEIYIPYTIEFEGQLIKLFDPIVHERVAEEQDHEFMDFENPFASGEETQKYDQRWVKIKRPTIIVGGELTLSMLDLTYTQYGKFYEAPLQMKANNGIFMIDDFGRQLVRPLDLLNRWIVPLEKRFDYLSTVTGNKLQIPFDMLLIFSTNLDPHQLADEAFLRRIKYKIEIKDPDENQWREIWELECHQHGLTVEAKALDYMLARWYTPYQRPLRMCHPRDILNQMINIAAYNMEQVTFSPDLIDAACHSYFISQEERRFAKTVSLS
jgi:GTPase SAR1 family protein